jgi:YVTN family beta-propeller protein
MRTIKLHLPKFMFLLLLIAALPIAIFAQPYAYVSNVSGNNVSVVNTANNTVVATIPVGASPNGVAVAPDGGLLYVACSGANTVNVISTASNSVIASIPVGASPMKLAVTPNGAQLYVVAQAVNQVNVIDTASKSVIANITVGSHPTRVAFSPDGTRGYVTNLYSGTVSIIDTNSRSVIGSFPTGSGPADIAVASNSRLYVSNQYSNTVTVHDLSGNLLATISGFLFPNAVAATPNGARVFATNGNGSTVSTIDTSSNSVMGTMAVGSNPTSVTVSSDGTMAYVVNQYSFSLSQLNVGGNFIANTLLHVGVYPIAVAMQPPASTVVPPPSCTYSLSASSASMSAAGGSGSVNVAAGANCSWSAVSNTGWAQVTGGRSGTGSGIVSYSVNANLSVSSQSGTMTIGGQTFTINEGGSAPPPPPPSGGTAAFVKADTTTGGAWKGVYGAEGYNIINDTANYPAYVSATPSGNASYTWVGSSTDVRALQKASSTTDRIAACWYTAGSFNIDLRFNDTNTHQMALYLLDWDNYNGRSERVDILDSNNNVLDSRSASSFVGGQYLVWNLSGHVIVRITNLNANSNAVLSGLLFGTSGSPTGTAAFVKNDITTAGSWKGVYGADGYNIINDTASYPAYVSATPSGNASYTWAGSTTDGRGLQKASSTTDRLAACWYTTGALSIDLRFNDSNTHQVALYLLDWDNFNGRTERVDILDSNNNVLDSRSASGFVGGHYLVWNLSGHVIVRITNTNAASNAAVSGILFR